ncbi:hypothetical protein BGX38DRAFT_834660 [Terfezia claveryi]|nr:hypothetical protein BGX38DRAFT_834660 [Terfezia claveryi]
MPSLSRFFAGLHYRSAMRGRVMGKPTFTTSSRDRNNIESPGGPADGAGTSIQLPGLKADRLSKIETDVAISLKLNERTNSEVKWVLGFGVGTVLLGIGSAVFKVYYYDAAREKDMKDYVKDTVSNSERVILAEMRVEMRAMEGRMGAKIESRTRWW